MSAAAVERFGCLVALAVVTTSVIGWAAIIWAALAIAGAL